MRTFFIAVAVVALLVQPVPAAARASDASPPSVFPSEHTRVRTETLWIFDADFEDLVGDNAGWTTDDASGTPEYVNYWHKDTIRINGFEHLGDSTWWCGTYNDCWRQPRGYGNDWICILERSFHELAYVTEPGDDIRLEYDQRFAIEPCYDYGYTDVSNDSGENWTTLTSVSDTHFGCSFGHSHDWDSTSLIGPGHQVLDLSAYAGQVIDLRFRFESDLVGSSQDMYNNPPGNAVLDGAWQLDNIAIYINDELFWLDDCESPGDNGWVHESIPASGQIGAVFERRLESLGGHSGWMMAAYDSTAGAILDEQSSRLFSPPIDISDAPSLVARWDGWADLPSPSDDAAEIFLHVDDIECLWTPGSWGWSVWELDPGDPEWVSADQDWSPVIGAGTHLGICLRVEDGAIAGGAHGKGFVLDRVRVGIPLATSVADVGVLVNELRHVCPNPFSSATTIAYSLASAGHVTVRIYDAASRVVRTLVDSEMTAGPRDVRWDGRTDTGDRAASGVYFVRMTLPDDTSEARAREQKLVLLK